MNPRKLFFGILLSASLASVQAATVYSVAIDTSSLTSGTQGFLDIAFNGGGTPTAPALASISDFASDGTLQPGSISTQGTVTGTLPSAVSLANDNAEYLEGFSFGKNIAFDLTLSGPALDNPSGMGSGSVFSVSLLNSTLDGSFLTSNVNDGFLFTFAIDPSGRVTSTTFPTETGAPSVTTIAAQPAVPEPASFALCMAALAAACVFLVRLRIKTALQH